MYGYKDVEEFYDRNNPLRDVDDISVPLLFISSEDDISKEAETHTPALI
jgi:predicted alpha/beta-fold hydrolase